MLLPFSEPVARARGMSPRRFRVEHVLRARPVLLEGSVAHWPALSRWTSDELARRLGDAKITGYRLHDGDVVLDGERGLVEAKLGVRDYARAVAAGTSPAHRVRSRLSSELPSLLDDLETPAYCRHGMPVEVNLWWAGAATRTHLHFDTPHNVLAQVRGSKRFVLFPARDRRLLSPRRLGAAAGQFSKLDLRGIDLERHPELRRAHPIEGVLHPGDALFIPSGVWHYLEGDDETMSVSFWWAPWTRLPLVVAADLYKRLRGFAR
jgi:hypothetical protein